MKTQVPVYVHQMILIRGQIESKLFNSKQPLHLLIPLKFPGSNILFVQLVVLAISLNFEAKVLPNVNFKLRRRC